MILANYYEYKRETRFEADLCPPPPHPPFVNNNELENYKT